MNKPRTKIGDVYGRLTVRSDGVNYVFCECECSPGILKEYSLHNLRRDNTKSCGCYHKERAAEARSLEKSEVVWVEDGIYEIKVFGKHKDVGRCLISEEDVELVKGRRWSVTHQKRKGRLDRFSVYTCINRKVVYLHTFIMNPPKGFQVDHRNGITWDNQRENLRIVTAAQNAMNRGSVGKTSKYIGVSWNKLTKKWISQIRLKDKSYTRYFDDEIEAAKDRDRVAKEFFGEYARLNFPPPELN